MKIKFGVYIILVFVFMLISSFVLASEQNKPVTRKNNIEAKGDARSIDMTSSRIIESGNKSEVLKNIEETKQNRRKYVEGEVIVKFKEDKINLKQNSGEVRAMNFASNKNLEKKENIKRNNISVLKIKGTGSVEEMVQELRKDPNVEYAEPNYRRYPVEIDSNDTHRGQLWGLDNTGQLVDEVSGTSGADISALNAWEISEGSENEVIVAIIDSGVAYNHPDLINNMWNGSNCLDENGAYLGDCNYGYDYVDNDRTPLPTNSSHGTHIAGTIGAVKNNSKGIIGVAPNVKIMALKFNLDVASEIKSINFAIQNGAKIINASYGGTSFSQFEYDIIEEFQQSGGLFIAAAGNESNNNDSSVHKYPSDYNLGNIISVAATDSSDNLASFSNYGTTSVDVGAPGVSIYSAIADSIVLFEDFEDTVMPNIPSGWSRDGLNNNFGTYDLGGVWGKVLYGDLAYPYSPDIDTTIASLTYNLNNTGGASISFWTACDTEYDLNYWTDYMALEISSDGINFDEYFKFDEPYIDSDSDSTGSAVAYFKDIEIPAQYLTSNFNFRFRWVTNSTDNNHSGCLIDDIKIVKYSNGEDEKYGFMQGTSMAAPHVAGLAGLIWGYNSELSYFEVKNIILETGDSLSSLSGKTVTGKRINAFNALQSLLPDSYAISGTVKYYDGEKKIQEAIVILEDDQNNQIATTITDVDGYYEFTEIEEGGNYIVRAQKSDNAFALSSADQISIGRHIVGLSPFDTIYKIIAGDVNDSGGLSSADQIKIGRFIVGLDSSLVSGTWKFYSSDSGLNLDNYLISGLSREFNNLEEEMSHQDFVGIKMGDVNNSWNNN